MRNLGAAIAGGGGARRDKDFYPTPYEATVALIESYLLGAQRGPVWEPACGDGAISRVLTHYHYKVVSSDLVDRGWGYSPLDFLAATTSSAPKIITNPPFNLAEAFVRHALGVLGARQVAFLLKAQFWNAAGRLPLFEEHRPAVIAPLTWRLDFTGGGAPTMDCAWVIWEPKVQNTAPVFIPLPKPILTDEDRALIDLAGLI